jgi:hypothetical protein
VNAGEWKDWGMSTQVPSREVRIMIGKLVAMLDWAEVPIHQVHREVLFGATGGRPGVAHSDGTMVFDPAVGRALEQAAGPGRLSDEEVAEFRRAIQVVTLTTLNKRADRPGGIVLNAGDEADQFVNVGMRDAYWSLHGQRIAYNLSPELGSRIVDAADAPGHSVAREAALELANHYGKMHHEFPDNAVRALLQVPRDEVFEAVVDSTLAHHIRENVELALEALSELRANQTNNLREGFQQLAQRADLEPAEVQASVAALCGEVDTVAQAVKHTVAAMGARQPAATAVQEHGGRVASVHRRTGFEPRVR